MLDVTRVAKVTFIHNVETGGTEMRVNDDYTSSFDQLTADQLRIAAMDLGNASRIEAMCGHSIGGPVDRTTGGLCLVGAIEVATYKQLYCNGQGKWFLFTTEEWCDAGVERADAAILVLAQVIPGGLCPQCPSDETACTYAWTSATHFSDFHCTGRDNAARILDLASIFAVQTSLRRTVASLPRQQVRVAAGVISA
jgi:hypothetical protein